jgi:aerobic carbon-monoxide dehydrogenase large subunit
VIGAITDALGITHLEMPATPERVWRTIQASNSKGGQHA